MNRRKAMTVVAGPKLTATKKAKLFDLINESKVEADSLAPDIYVASKYVDEVLPLVKDGTLDVKANFPMMYAKVDATDEREGLYTLDNKSKYVVMSVEDYRGAQDAVKDIPIEDTKVTEKFIDGLSTKTALVAWLKARGLEIDTDMHKADLFKAVKKYYGIMEIDNDTEKG